MLLFARTPYIVSFLLLMDALDLDGTVCALKPRQRDNREQDRETTESKTMTFCICRQFEPGNTRWQQPLQAGFIRSLIHSTHAQ